MSLILGLFCSALKEIMRDGSCMSSSINRSNVMCVIRGFAREYQHLSLAVVWHTSRLRLNLGSMTILNATTSESYLSITCRLCIICALLKSETDDSAKAGVSVTWRTGFQDRQA